MDLAAIMALVPHRHPFLLLDCVLRLDKRERIVAEKRITGDESFLQGHFPGKPIMPGVLIIEAMAQAGVVLYTLSVDETEAERAETKFIGQVEARFLKPAFPGDRLVIDLKVIRILKGAIALKGIVEVAGQPIVKGEFLLMQPRRRSEPEGDACSH